LSGGEGLSQECDFWDLIRDGAELLGGVLVSNPQKRGPEWPETEALFLLRPESSASYFLTESNMPLVGRRGRYV